MHQHRASRSFVAAATLVLAVALGGCGDDADEPKSATSSSPAPGASSSPTRDPQGSASSTDDTGTALDVRINGDDVSPTAETMELSTGDVLTVKVDADRAGELHVHSSPEQYVEFGPGTSRHEITLDKPGQVDVEEHDSGVLVARLLVD